MPDLVPFPLMEVVEKIDAAIGEPGESNKGVYPMVIQGDEKDEEQILLVAVIAENLMVLDTQEITALVGISQEYGMEIDIKGATPLRTYKSKIKSRPIRVDFRKSVTHVMMVPELWKILHPKKPMDQYEGDRF